MSSFVRLFLVALTYTVSAELVCGIILKLFADRLGFSWPKKIGWADFVFGVIVASVMTLPYVWFVYYDFIKDRTTFAVVSELWAWLAEALFYKYYFRTGLKRVLAFSFLLNLFSFLVGLLIVR